MSFDICAQYFGMRELPGFFSTSSPVPRRCSVRGPESGSSVSVVISVVVSGPALLVVGPGRYTRAPNTSRFSSSSVQGPLLVPSFRVLRYLTAYRKPRKKSSIRIQEQLPNSMHGISSEKGPYIPIETLVGDSSRKIVCYVLPILCPWYRCRQLTGDSDDKLILK